LSSGGYACLVDGPEEAIAVANVVAPEHLELLIDDGRRLLPFVEAAGAVFLGPWSPASLGDYVAGSNHVLPTNRSARFSSALSARDFRRYIHVVEADREALSVLGPHVVTLAKTEGLAAHAQSIEVRR
jgi:histidinol dehydrogenase